MFTPCERCEVTRGARRVTSERNNMVGSNSIKKYEDLHCQMCCQMRTSEPRHTWCAEPGARC
eukprot:1832739-Prymnesium_polylepis.1